METTYRHLSDEDAIEAVTALHEGREAIVDSPLTPDGSCPNCGVNLPPNSKACFNCGTLFTPDAMAIQESLSEKLP